MEQPQVHLALALEHGSEPITGSVEDEDGHRREFQGWMELAAALDALLNLQPSGSPHEGSTRTN